MNEFFFSYSRQDLKIVDQFVEALAKEGINVWLDREDIKVGNSWRVQIVEAIDTCQAFVLMLSPNSAASKNVHKEVILAQDSARPTYVVMLEAVRLPPEIRYPLAGLQFINFPLLGFEKSLHQLIEALKPYQKKIIPEGETAHKQTELVIQGVDLSSFTAEKQAQLIAFISDLANADPSQLKIARMTAGSVHVFMNMPAEAAYQLKTMALNSDPRFKSLNIVSLRIAGDIFYIHIAQGTLSPSPKPDPIKIFFSSMWGRLLTMIFALLILIGLTTFNPFKTTPAAPDPTLAWSATPSMSAPLDTPTASATQIPSQTSTVTAAPTDTSTPTLTPVVYRTLSAVVAGQRIACNYGPGDLYLNDETLRQGLSLQVYGRDINSGWGYVLADGYAAPCWVNLKSITLDGKIENLEPLYPGIVTLPPSDFWPPPQNVYTARSKSNPDKLSIYWDAFILKDGDLEGSGAPRYLLELWLCKGGQLTFTPIFAWDNNLVVDDEAGCIEPSSGVIYISEKHGYPGPVTIPWTPHP
ncbi:MAG: TIR domain-containing protein [Anaerolineales bacterium]|nr:TIR domain-containing protein [Anaerolineales bacterium]